MKRKVRLVAGHLAKYIFPPSKEARQLMAEGKLHIEMARISPGTFCMGDDRRDKSVWPAHQVSINYAFEIGKYKVTRGQWDAVMGENSIHLNRGGGDNDKPVDSVSYEDAQRFIRLLNFLTKGGFRLPSEAEWEYACCAPEVQGDSCNDNAASGTVSSASASHPNIFGLYNTNSELWEWVEDYYHEDYLGAPQDGSAWRTTRGGKFGRDRVLRGGSMGSCTDNGFTLVRNHFIPRGRSSSFSFRLARTIETTPSSAGT